MTKIKKFDAIIYHGPCPDGTAGLWCANHYRYIEKKISCRAGNNPTEDLSNLNVVFVDICPKIDYLLELVKIANYVAILDHHKSSEQMILDNKNKLDEIKNLYIEFDMNRSGCQIAWDYFFDNTGRPFFIDYIGDRDLWKWELPYSKEINTGLWKLGYIDFYKMNELLDNQNEKMETIKNVGTIFESCDKTQIDIGISNAIETTLISNNKTYRLWLGGNINPALKSDFGNALCLKSFSDNTLPDFSAIWQYDPKLDEWWISLRGINTRSPDLSIISNNYGGGGHPMASGFTIKSSKGLKEIFNY